jgi:hypothetical protein
MSAAWWSTIRMRAALRASILVASLTAAVGGPRLLPAAELADDPWSHLQALRDNLDRKALSADFVQTFLPAGFSSGDEESGILHLSIPECLRWDYLQPYPKTYLVCGHEAYTWNEGESQGRRFFLESDSEPGLDLLRLNLDSLKSRYSLEARALDTTQLEIVFTPLDAGVGLVEASIVVDIENQLLTRLTYQDLEGNQTRFDISRYRPISGSLPFAVPDNLEWLGD